jgi:hypothetical protein
MAEMAPDVPHGDEAGEQSEGAGYLIFDEVALGRELLVGDGDVDGHVVPHLREKGEHCQPSTIPRNQGAPLLLDL